MGEIIDEDSEVQMGEPRLICHRCLKEVPVREMTEHLERCLKAKEPYQGKVSGGA